MNGASTRFIAFSLLKLYSCTSCLGPLVFFFVAFIFVSRLVEYYLYLSDYREWSITCTLFQSFVYIYLVAIKKNTIVRLQSLSEKLMNSHFYHFHSLKSVTLMAAMLIKSHRISMLAKICLIKLLSLI
jgi:hypothetical protein